MNGEIVERVRRSTVQVETPGDRPGTGSGVIAGPDAIVITNAHVVREETARVHLWDGRVVEARVVKKNPRRDLAELRIHVAGLPSLPFGDSDTLKPGHIVVAVGNPLGFQGAASAGVVRAVGPVQGLGSHPWVQASVRLAPGNSGGPLADAHGHLVGINTMVLSRGGLGLAIPSRAVNEFITRPSPPRLGVAVRGVPVSAPRRGLGLLLLQVEAGAPAGQASLQTGDILVAADGRPFTSADQLPDALERASQGGELRLQFLRGDRQRVREVTVRL
jgi:serine protease Do